MPRAIVFAYGNTLRSDDGVGWRIGEMLEHVAPPDVQVCLSHQLTPDQAADIGDAQLVVFVDARLVEQGDTGGVDVSEIVSSSAPADTHRLSPGEVLWLAWTLFGATPRAYLVTAPAFSLEIGEELSPRTAELVPHAVSAIKELLDFPSA